MFWRIMGVRGVSRWESRGVREREKGSWDCRL